jgi:uncharacterized phage protein (TIGR02216 family)
VDGRDTPGHDGEGLSGDERKGVVGKMTEPFPWRTIMAVGLGRLRLASDVFWAMTPRELAAAIDGLRGHVGAPIARAALGELMARYPDQADRLQSRLSNGDTDR